MAKGKKFDFDWKGDSVMAKLVGTSNDNVKAAAVFLKSAIKLKLTGNRTGRVYRVPGTKTLYTASAPGEAPASRTGTLRNSIIFRIDKGARNAIQAFVGAKKLGTDEGYAYWLEFGTRNMAPRPFLRPVFDEQAGAVKTILRAGWV